MLTTTRWLLQKPYKSKCKKNALFPYAFSLVEVTLALGIVSFGLLAVIGLLPTGLSSVKNAQEQAFAMQCLTDVATCIQAANSPAVATGATSRTFTALAPYNGLNGSSLMNWKVPIPSSGTDVTKPAPNPNVQYELFLDLNGAPVAQQSQSRSVAFVSISPPATLLTQGSAYICVAWPGPGIQHGTPSDSTLWKTVPTGANTDQATRSVVVFHNQQGYVEKTIYFNAR